MQTSTLVINRRDAVSRIDHLSALEAESIAIFREVLAEFSTPAAPDHHGAAERLARLARSASTDGEAADLIRRALEELVV